MKMRESFWSAAFALCALMLGLLAGRAVCQAQSTAGTGPVLEQRHPRYILQREDVLLISFPLSTELNQTVTIQPDGYISLQNAGSVYAQGLTTSGEKRKVMSKHLELMQQIEKNGFKKCPTPGFHSRISPRLASIREHLD